MSRHRPSAIRVRASDGQNPISRAAPPAMAMATNRAAPGFWVDPQIDDRSSGNQRQHRRTAETCEIAEHDLQPMWSNGIWRDRLDHEAGGGLLDRWRAFRLHGPRLGVLERGSSMRRRRRSLVRPQARMAATRVAAIAGRRLSLLLLPLRKSRRCLEFVLKRRDLLAQLLAFQFGIDGGGVMGDASQHGAFIVVEVRA
jgi:hypothetical protein